MTARKLVGSVLTLVHLIVMLSEGPTRALSAGELIAIARAEAMTEKTKTNEACIAAEGVKFGLLALGCNKRGL